MAVQIAGVTVIDDSRNLVNINNFNGSIVVTSGNFTTYGGLASGTRAIFQQAAAPTGWTTDATHNDKAIRLVSGGAGVSSGGTVGFATAFSTSRAISGTAQSKILDETMIPAHSHTYSRALAVQNTTNITGSGNRVSSLDQTSVNSGLTGGGLGHDHTLSGSVNINVSYVDFIICVKS